MQGISPDGIQAYVASEKAQHSKDLYTSTFVPYLGMVLNGDHSNGYFGMQDAQMYYASQSVATLKMQGDISDIPYVASKDNPEGYKRQLYNVSRKPLLEFTTPLKKKLWESNVESQRRMAYMQSGGQIPYVASVPPGGNDSAAQVVGPLTQIPFIQDVLGFPTPEYHINELTTKVPLPQLHAEQPETDWGTPNLQLEPTQFVENRRPEFQSHFFLAKRNEYAFFIPREYRYRATIDPYNIYVRQASDGLRQAREALTLLALSRLKATSDIPDPTANAGTAGFPAALNNVKSEFESIFADYWQSTRLQVDSIVMHPVDFVEYESNFYTNGWQGYNDVSDWGVTQMPGFKRRIRVAMSPFCPRRRIYMFNSRFVLTGEGPMVTETWAKPEANSDAGAYRDYVDVTVFNPGRAGRKAAILGGTAEPEITTLEEARNLIKPPDGLLNA